MQIMNRSGDTVTLKVFDNLDGVRLTPIWGGQIENNSSYEAPFGVDNTAIRIVSDFTAFPKTLAECGPFPNVHKVVIVKRNGNYQMVDAIAVYDQWTTGSDAKYSSSNSNALATGLAVGEALLDALATGLEATGPAGDIAAALVLGVGSLILTAIGGQQNPPAPPPSLDQITTAVQNVVADELASNNADQSATYFQMAANWYILSGRSVYAQLLGKGEPGSGDLSAHDEADFLRDLEEYVDPESPFQTNLEFIKDNPESGKYILPSLITGIVTDLHLRWLHIMIRKLDGARITKQDLNDYLELAKEDAISLKHTGNTFSAFVQGKITSANLQGTPEGGGLVPIITKIYTGHTDLSFVQRADTQLHKVIGSITADIHSVNQSKPTKHVWKEEWSRHRRSTRHPNPA